MGSTPPVSLCTGVPMVTLATASGPQWAAAGVEGPVTGPPSDPADPAAAAARSAHNDSHTSTPVPVACTATASSAVPASTHAPPALRRQAPHTQLGTVPRGVAARASDAAIAAAASSDPATPLSAGSPLAGSSHDGPSSMSPRPRSVAPQVGPWLVSNTSPLSRAGHHKQLHSRKQSGQ